MNAIERHRKIWEGKSDEWIFERLDKELKDKVEEIHRLLAENESLRQQSANRFTEDDLRNAFYAGCKFENGDRKSWESYNKFTGKQQPNKEMNFEQWYESNYR